MVEHERCGNYAVKFRRWNVNEEKSIRAKVMQIRIDFWILAKVSYEHIRKSARHASAVHFTESRKTTGHIITAARDTNNNKKTRKMVSNRIELRRSKLWTGEREPMGEPGNNEREVMSRHRMQLDSSHERRTVCSRSLIALSMRFNKLQLKWRAVPSESRLLHIWRRRNCQFPIGAETETRTYLRQWSITIIPHACTCDDRHRRPITMYAQGTCDRTTMCMGMGFNGNLQHSRVWRRRTRS